MKSLGRQQEQRLARFRRLGLECNPFRVVEASELAELWLPVTGIEPATLLAAPEPAVQIIAPAGWGKSITLRAIEHVAGQQALTTAYLYCPPDKPVRLILPRPSASLLLLDEADRLGPFGWWRTRRWLARGARKLVAGTHEDIQPRLRLPVRTIRLPPCNTHTLAAFIARRIAWAGGDPQRFRFCSSAIERLDQLAGGSLRQAELICYELFQMIETPPGSATIGPELVELAHRAAVRNLHQPTQ